MRGPQQRSSGARGGARKDTQANIEETGEFVVNIMSEWFIEAANHTCGNFDPDVSEWDLSGLTPIPSEQVCLRMNIRVGTTRPGLRSEAGNEYIRMR